MRNNRSIKAALLFVGLLAVLSLYRSVTLQPAQPPAAESTLQRVKRTKTLVCAYYLWPELMEKDPNTGAMHGAVVDVVQKVADALNAKVIWQEEATIDNFVQLIDSKRVDAMCAPFSPIAPNIHASVRFSHPIYYGRFDALVRADDARFDSGPETVDDPGTRLLTLDGSAAGYIAAMRFPKAQKSGLPAVLGQGQALLDVKAGKADITVSEQLSAGRFLENNPGSLKPLRWKGQSLLVAGLSPFLTKLDDVVWSATINAILDDLVQYGVVDQILSDHGLKAGLHYQPIARPYTISP